MKERREERKSRRMDKTKQEQKEKSQKKRKRKMMRERERKRVKEVAIKMATTAGSSLPVCLTRCSLTSCLH